MNEYRDDVSMSMIFSHGLNPTPIDCDHIKYNKFVCAIVSMRVCCCCYDETRIMA